jgi:hypothetical protein
MSPWFVVTGLHITVLSPGFARFGRLVPQWDVESAKVTESAGGFLVELDAINCASGTPLISVDNILVSETHY